MTWRLWEARPESQSATHEPRVLRDEEPNRPINPGEAAEYGATVQARSSQVKALHKSGLAATWRDSLPIGLILLVV